MMEFLRLIMITLEIIEEAEFWGQVMSQIVIKDLQLANYGFVTSASEAVSRLPVYFIYVLSKVTK